MAEQDYDEEYEFDDPYAVRITLPYTSWKYARPKDGFTGIILPVFDKTGAEVPFTMSQQMSPDGELLWWVDKDGKKQPRPQQIFLLGDLVDVKTGKPFTLEDYISTKSTDRFSSALETGSEEAAKTIKLVEEFRLRKQTVKGKYLWPGFRTAAASMKPHTGTLRPVIGAYVTIILDRLIPNDYAGETKEYSVTMKPPTEASLAFVQRYRDATRTEADPYAGQPASSTASAAPTAAPASEEEPPF